MSLDVEARCNSSAVAIFLCPLEQSLYTNQTVPLHRQILYTFITAIDLARCGLPLLVREIRPFPTFE